MRGALSIIGFLVLAASACASITPAVPRFVAVYEQRSTFCRIQVIHDTRSTACFVAARCGHHPVQFVPVAPEVCVP